MSMNYQKMWFELKRKVMTGEIVFSPNNEANEMLRIMDGIEFAEFSSTLRTNDQGGEPKKGTEKNYYEVKEKKAKKDKIVRADTVEELADLLKNSRAEKILVDKKMEVPDELLDLAREKKVSIAQVDFYFVVPEGAFPPATSLDFAAIFGR